ncbi:MAG: hypothetical protein IKI92_00715 [Anaerotignum sp.]|nr:hypothetical protein [Anaerotignum sp.]
MKKIGIVSPLLPHTNKGQSYSVFSENRTAQTVGSKQFCTAYFRSFAPLW